MKNVTSLLFFFCYSIISNLTIASDVVVKNYFIETKISFATQSVQVDLICSLQKNSDSDDIQFLLNSSYQVNSISYFDGNDWLPLSFNFNGKDSLLLIMWAVLQNDSNLEIKFNYTFEIEEMNDTLLLLDRGHRWYPLISNQVFTYKMKCEVPDSYSVLSSGNLIEKVDTGNSFFIYECEKPVFKMPLIVFKRESYQHIEFLSEKNKLDFYSKEIDSTEINKLLNQADSILSYFITTIGPYSREELRYFEISDFEGINVGSGLLTIGTQSVEMINKGYKDMLILTIAQQWFGANVFADFSEPGFFFFTISLPNYLKLMYIRDNKGEAAFNNALLKPLDNYKEFAGNEGDIPINNVDMPNTREKGLILYAKGPYVLNMLAQEIGSETWKLFLRDIYKTFLGKIMTMDDFENYINKYDTSGNSLALFKKLLNEKGLPQE